jgi:coproporphyrinogen III oxidase-like Fe-S oxidoreductase
MRLSEWQWLARQTRPVWQGLVGREIEDADLRRAIEKGLIERSGDGFAITQEGRDFADHRACPTCGQLLRTE